jgi:hypothetical protein
MLIREIKDNRLEFHKSTMSMKTVKLISLSA